MPRKSPRAQKLAAEAMRKRTDRRRDEIDAALRHRLEARAMEFRQSQAIKRAEFR